MSTYTLIIGNKNYSSWSLRPWLVLKQTGIDFAEIRIPLDTPNTRQQILQYSPTGRVPVLQHDRLHIWDSLAICEYLAEQFPHRHLYPQDQETRAIARAISAEMHSGFPHLRQHLSMDCRTRHPAKTFAPEVQADIDRIQQIWQTCRQQYGTNGDYLFGEFSIADAMFAPVASRFITYSVPLTPPSQAYVEAIFAHPPMQEWLAAAAAETEQLDNH
jgi:glutathione S-transferase